MEYFWTNENMSRIYLDHNATMPLRREALEAMVAAMDVVGNPSSVHAEGRAAKAVVERARAQVAEAFGASGADIVFTSSATEAAALAFCAKKRPNEFEHGEDSVMISSPVEHDAIDAWSLNDISIPIDSHGRATFSDELDESGIWDFFSADHIFSLQAANSETGVVQDVSKFVQTIKGIDPGNSYLLSDFTQAFGKIPVSFSWTNIDLGIVSAHKLGGPKGVGALVLQRGIDLESQIKGGGQEMGRRSGTENVIGIAGFGAAAEAVARDLADGIWDRVAELRNILEKTIEAETKNTIFVGIGADRLPNTSCFATPGWKGEMQVMQMDLAGFAISAGSACSSGKVKASRVLKAMGFDDVTAASAVRVSLGPETTEQEVMAFAEAWLKAEKKFQAKAA